VNFSDFDRECMALALQLAEKGLYTTDPNPRVGCVIADGEAIVGRGWHQRAGDPHAEIEALRDAGRPVRGCTAYVTLEPCSHHGRTPPCVNALLEAGLGRVVIASRDPNPDVNGSGLERLRAGGVQVDEGLMAEAAESLNCGFFSRMRDGRPWVRVKSAISLDGRTALRSGESKWISGPESRSDVQHWRARSSAILTGIGTVIADNPRMTARVETPVIQPLRVVADSRWRTPPDSRILENPDEALLAGDGHRDVPAALSNLGVPTQSVPASASGIDLGELLKALAEREVNEIQVEAGARLCGGLLESGLVDELLIYQAPVLLGDGGPGPFRIGPLESMSDRTHFEIMESRKLGNDLRIRLRPTRRH
jgi:diaminohydroxyphosphoribosylaminopyrimidine deaminase/5-amino-6-(5-phosphoribosylamino)uracil reductase